MNWVDIEYERERFQDYVRQAANDRLARTALQSTMTAKPKGQAVSWYARGFIQWLRRSDELVPNFKYSFED